MLRANLKPAEDVVLRFRAQAFLLIGQNTADCCSCRLSWSIGEHNIDLIAGLQVVHFLIPFENPTWCHFGRRSLCRSPYFLSMRDGRGSFFPVWRMVFCCALQALQAF